MNELGRISNQDLRYEIRRHLKVIEDYESGIALMLWDEFHAANAKQDRAALLNLFVRVSGRVREIAAYEDVDLYDLGL